MSRLRTRVIQDGSWDGYTEWDGFVPCNGVQTRVKLKSPGWNPENARGLQWKLRREYRSETV
jgi:hypothetical protein